MKAKELMIGDWVKIKTYGVSDKYERTEAYIYVKIAKICSCLITVEYNNEINEPYCICKNTDIEPIQLTSEILEKNGFENIGDDTYQLEEKPCWFWVDFFRHTYGCEYDTSTYEYEDDEHRLKLYGIPSVHELQHALRLCGIEKEIEL